MLSATPVNNGFSDLRHQLELAYEGDAALINEKLGTSKPIDVIFRNAQAAFNKWSKSDTEDRTTENLLRTLGFDFFTLLDSVTIARSRKHIEKYYDMSAIGTFPKRMKPLALRRTVSPKDRICRTATFASTMTSTGTLSALSSGLGA